MVNYQKHLIADIFKQSSAAHPIPGVQVYHNNFIENGIRALAISFPTLAHIMGNADFRGLARAFLVSEVKTQFDWADYGQTLPDFIMAHANLVGLPYLAEVAELDWLLHEVQRSEDKSFDGESFAKMNELDPSEWVFEMAPGFKLASFFFPVDQLYRLAHDAELANKGPLRDAFTQDLAQAMTHAIKLDKPWSMAVWRPRYKAKMLKLDDHDLAAFQRLEKSQSIADIFTHFSRRSMDISAWLSEQIIQKRIYGVRVKHSKE
jgi:hypothetical protein